MTTPSFSNPSNPIHDEPGVYFVVGDFAFDLLTQRVTQQETPVHLPTTEFNFLLCLARQMGQAVSHDILWRAV